MKKPKQASALHKLIADLSENLEEVRAERDGARAALENRDKMHEQAMTAAKAEIKDLILGPQGWRERFKSQNAEIGELKKENAEARAEIERLKVELNQCQLANMDKLAEKLNSKLARETIELRASPFESEEVQGLVEALKLGNSTTYPDPQHQEEVTRLGMRIGFGALMHAANYGWQQVLKEKGWPLGGEFVFGPCKSTRDTALAAFEAARIKAGGG